MKKLLAVFFILVFLCVYKLLSCPCIEWIKEEIDDWKNEEKEEDKKEEEAEENEEEEEENEEEEEEAAEKSEDSYYSQDPADGDQLKFKTEC